MSDNGLLTLSCGVRGNGLRFKIPSTPLFTDLIDEGLAILEGVLTDERKGSELMPARVVYFNIDGGLDYENQLLAEWGVADKIELVGVTTP